MCCGRGLEPQGRGKGKSKAGAVGRVVPRALPSESSFSYHGHSHGSSEVGPWVARSEMGIEHHPSLGIRSLGSSPSSTTRCVALGGLLPSLSFSFIMLICLMLTGSW